LEATAQFFDLLVAGQRKIRELWKHQVEQLRKAERLRNKENAEFRAEGMEIDDAVQQNQEYDQQIIIKSNILFYIFFYLFSEIYVIYFYYCMNYI